MTLKIYSQEELEQEAIRTAKLINVKRKTEPEGTKFFLYHGTTMKAWAEIQKQRGIKPRKVTGSKGNWEHNATDSRPDLVYLTDAYGCYYASAACGDDDKPVVLKIQVDPKKFKLFADEDVIFYGLQQKPQPDGKILYEENFEVLRGIDPTAEEWAHVTWQFSLKFLGTCAAKFVPLSAIKEMATGDALQWAVDNDATMNPTHYAILGEKYRQYMQQLNWQKI